MCGGEGGGECVCEGFVGHIPPPPLHVILFVNG